VSTSGTPTAEGEAIVMLGLVVVVIGGCVVAFGALVWVAVSLLTEPVEQIALVTTAAALLAAGSTVTLLKVLEGGFRRPHRR
jgi:hypothetical protein